MPEPSEQKISSKKGMKAFLLGVLVVLVLLGGVGYVLAKKEVRQLSEKPLILRAASFFHLPAATVNGDVVPYQDYSVAIQTLRTFYKTHPEEFPGMAEEDLPGQVLTRLFANDIVADAAKKYHVPISDVDVDSAVANLIQQFDSEEAAKAHIEETFGWKFDLYVERVVKPLLLEDKLRQAFSGDTPIVLDPADPDLLSEQVHARHILFPVNSATSTEEVRGQAEAVLKRIQNGEDFATLAKEFGSDSTKDVGGDLGWFTQDMMVKEFGDVAFALEPGKVAEKPVETQFGFHLIKVEGKRTVPDFDKFMARELRNADVVMYMNMENPLKAFNTVPDTAQSE